MVMARCLSNSISCVCFHLAGRLQPRVLVLDELRSVRAGTGKHDTAEDCIGDLSQVRQVSAGSQTRAAAQRPEAHPRDLRQL